MTFTPAALVNVLKNEPPNDAVSAAIVHLERLEVEGCRALSLGTYADGMHPKSWTEWAGHFCSLQDFLRSRTPEQISADSRAGEDFLKLDTALCERDWAINILAKVVAQSGHDWVDNMVRDWFKGREALKYYENIMKIETLRVARK